MQIVNIAVYKFATLTQLAERRERLRMLCKSLRLRGTILLATEGINLFVAGSRESIDALLSDLQNDEEIGALETKESFTDYQPFNRMLVKIKKEIISFGVDVPAGEPAGDKLPAATLCQWLDEGRDLVLLDTRNEFEVEVGTFDGAKSPGIESFTQFPDAIEKLPSEWRDRTMVTFCTGGIRCEKAAPFLRERGFEKVFQLDGGILKYFEQVGGKHYHGDCFVFDQRVAVDAALRETGAAQCYECQAVLDEEDQASPLYVVGKHCPYCYRADEAAMAAVLEKRTTQWNAACQPLPGREPYQNRRPLYVASRFAGLPLIDFLTEAVPALTRDQWQDSLTVGRVRLDDVPVGASRTVTVGEAYEHVTDGVVEPAVATDLSFVYEDAALLAIDKPAPLPMHPSGRFNKNTLTKLLEPIYLPQRIRPMHRLDANTTGLVLFARTRRIAQLLQKQLETGGIEKTYLALVAGSPEWDETICNRPVADSPSEAGVRLLDDDGLPAETRFRVVNRDGDQTLVEAQPITGRTNQIRLHLWSLGLPIVGDPTYAAGGQVADRQTLSVDDPPMCLHAWKLALSHPTERKPMEFIAPYPDWAEAHETRALSKG